MRRHGTGHNKTRMEMLLGSFLSVLQEVFTDTLSTSDGTSMPWRCYFLGLRPPPTPNNSHLTKNAFFEVAAKESKGPFEAFLS